MVNMSKLGIVNSYPQTANFHHKVMANKPARHVSAVDAEAGEVNLGSAKLKFRAP